jgi:hypothetical protein
VQCNAMAGRPSGFAAFGLLQVRAFALIPPRGRAFWAALRIPVGGSGSDCIPCGSEAKVGGDGDPGAFGSQGAIEFDGGLLHPHAGVFDLPSTST